MTQDLRNYDWWEKGLDSKNSISRLDITFNVFQLTPCIKTFRFSCKRGFHMN